MSGKAAWAMRSKAICVNNLIEKPACFKRMASGGTNFIALLLKIRPAGWQARSCHLSDGAERAAIDGLTGQALSLIEQLFNGFASSPAPNLHEFTSGS